MTHLISYPGCLPHSPSLSLSLLYLRLPLSSNDVGPPCPSPTFLPVPGSLNEWQLLPCGISAWHFSSPNENTIRHNDMFKNGE